MATEYVKTIECPKCRYKNVAGTKFCGDCGIPLGGSPIPCGKCGTENPSGTKFCGNCGNNLQNPQENDPDVRHLQDALRGKYVIQKPLGEGGFGRVFLAEHTGLGQRHVIKLLSADSSRSTDIRNRFFQEAQLIARLKHPNIVPIMDVAEYQGRPYYIMSYLNGGSLEDLLIKEKRLSTEKALQITAKILSALSEVHSKGIIHRDLKPNNVLLDESGEPILIDFGIARVEEGGKAKTGTGYSIGTPTYMSPEQLDAKPITLTTDIYSMGIMLFELLTGKPPFEGSMSSLINQHNTAKLPSVSGKIENSKLADGIQAVLQKACAKEPSARYGSANEMREAVLGLIQESKAVNLPSMEPKQKEETIKTSLPVVENRDIETIAPEPQRLEDGITEKKSEGVLAVTINTYYKLFVTFSFVLGVIVQFIGKSNFSDGTEIIGLYLLLFLIIFNIFLLYNRYGYLKRSKLFCLLAIIPPLGILMVIVTAFMSPDVAKATAVEYPSSPKTHTNSIGMEFVLIPAGEFMMGAVPQDNRAIDYEMPQHKVQITKPFYMGKYPVTQEEWEKVMGNNPSDFKKEGKRAPVENVSWNDCQEFIKKLSQKEGKTYKLPTEAEWEYAARGGNSTSLVGEPVRTTPTGSYIYTYGDDVGKLGEFAWYSNNSSGTTHPVGQKKPNLIGLYDVMGNVMEWCGDRYKKDYYKESWSVDTKGPDKGSRRVLRGGSWDSDADENRLSYRYSRYPREYFNRGGFRLVLLP